MSYQVQFSDRAYSYLQKLDRPIQERILAALERIRIRPHVHVRRLVGGLGYRLRVGDYRVIMDIRDDILYILVLKIGHRRNIYEP